MRLYTLSDMRSKKKLRVYTASEAKGLTDIFLKVCAYWLDIKIYKAHLMKNINDYRFTYMYTVPFVNMKLTV